MVSILGYVKLFNSAFAPERATPNSAGYDLRAPYSCIVPAKGKLLVLTNLSFQLPPNTYGRIAPRSGLALNYFIDVGAGVVDRDYRGNVVDSLTSQWENIDDTSSFLNIPGCASPAPYVPPTTAPGFGKTAPTTTSTTKGKRTRKEKVIPSKQSSKSGNDGDYTLKGVIELFIILGLTSANAWEKTILKIKKYVSDAMNVELTNLYFSLRLVSQSVCAGVAENSDLSQEKLEQINEHERQYEELMGYITPTLDAVAPTTFSKNHTQLCFISTN